MDSLDKNSLVNYPMQTSFKESLVYCHFILPKVSRSFALGINSLSGEVKRCVLVGYLLCRIIDTVEDDPHLDAKLKEQYLKKFTNCFDNKQDVYFYSNLALELNGDAFHIDLVKNTHKVFEVFDSFSTNSKSILKRWVSEMANGMALFVNRYPFGIRISHIAEYKEYCYFVAGTVGYLLTDLWKEYACGINESTYKNLYKKSGIFGEGLQTINILKDISWDVCNENAIYVPLESLEKFGVTHKNMLQREFLSQSEKAVCELILLAHENLSASTEYVKSIPKINPRIRFFCIFPLLMAFATLRELKSANNLLTPDKVIKITRAEVKKIMFYSLGASFSNLLLNRFVKRILKK